MRPNKNRRIAPSGVPDSALCAQTWQAQEAAQRWAPARMACCCSALTQLLAGLGKQGIEGAPGLLGALVSGVSAHLDSPLAPLK